MASGYKALAILLGLAASIFTVLAIAVFEGYIPTTLTDGLNDFELGVVAALFVVAAGGAYAASQSD